MASKIEVRQLRTYFNGVLEKAHHHAGKVDKVVYYLLGAVLQVSKNAIEVRTYRENVTNEIWFYTENGRYCMVYDHERKCIALKENTHDKDDIATFDNDSTLQKVLKVFQDL